MDPAHVYPADVASKLLPSESLRLKFMVSVMRFHKLQVVVHLLCAYRRLYQHGGYTIGLTYWCLFNFHFPKSQGSPSLATVLLRVSLQRLRGRAAVWRGARLAPHWLNAPVPSRAVCHDVQDFRQLCVTTLSNPETKLLCAGYTLTFS